MRHCGWASTEQMPASITAAMASPMPMNAVIDSSNAISAAVPPVSHGQELHLRPWSAEDREALRALHAEQLSCAEIARRLNRSVEAVSNMSRRQGLRRRETALPWTQQDIFTLEKMLIDGRSLRQIAEATGHPRSSVADKLRQLSITSQRFRKPWTGRERETVLSLHAAGACLAAITEALPGRSLDAVQQKLQELVGPAPFRVAQRQQRLEPHSSSGPVESAEVDPPSPSPPPLPTPSPQGRIIHDPRPAQAACIVASIEEMIRWLRSRDYMVLHRSSGWQVDRHILGDECALLEFVNARRGRLALPPYALRGNH